MVEGWYTMIEGGGAALRHATLATSKTLSVQDITVRNVMHGYNGHISCCSHHITMHILTLSNSRVILACIPPVLRFHRMTATDAFCRGLHHTSRLPF